MNKAKFAGILTAERIEEILAEAPFDEIELDGLGYEIYEDQTHHLSLALKYESGIEDTEPGYLVNLFYNRDEYIGIPGFYYRNKLLCDSHLHEMIAREWNKLVMYGIFRNWFNAEHDASIDDAETAERVKAAEQVLRDSGIPAEYVPAVLQTLGKVLLDKNIYEEEV